MKNDWLDNSSLYLNKHNNTYMYILYPIMSLVLFFLFFLFWGEIEDTLKVDGVVEPSQLESIQVFQELSIKENNLKEGKKVKKNDVLLSFDDDSMIQKKIILIDEKNSLLEKTKSLEILRLSLVDEINYFESIDIYGYSNMLNTFLTEKEIASQSNIVIQKDQESAQTNASATNNQLDIIIIEKKETLDYTEQLRQAIEKDNNSFSVGKLEIDNLFLSLKEQIALSNDELKKSVKYDILVNLDDKIVNLKAEIMQLELEKSKQNIPDITEQEKRINSLKGNILKEQLFTDIALKKQEIETEIKEKDNQIEEIGNELSKYVILAKTDGYLHVNEEYLNDTIVPKGTVIANILPALNKENIVVKAYIPVANITDIEKNMKFNFKSDKKRDQDTIKGEIVGISETSIETEEGRYYQITGCIDKQSSIENIRYGMTGEISIILEKKTYIDYLKDFLFN